ncbi:hypothetical protein [Gluconobacter morbifer]|uniref:Rod shape-determining protein MreD n=1 Tax=Gluconobacter morbifer G707 TaxID=1088869 RepID=G6XG20_9PROT|nr:hypothetical protein [Gluconobacter morbifer]EHH69128.1 hypothetical protein GMO_04350 [Gluconobacter morbifer G707]
MVAENSTPHLHSAVEPKPSVGRTLDALARAAMPSVFIVLSAILLSAPFGVPGQAELQFGIAMCTVWFWAYSRPKSMPAIAVFLCGLVIEVFSFGPPGTVLLSLLVIYGVAHHWRYGLSRLNFVVGWLIFSLFAALASFFQWALVCIHAFALLSPAPGLFQAALTIGIYPTLTALFVWGRRTFANPDQA